MPTTGSYAPGFPDLQLPTDLTTIKKSDTQAHDAVANAVIGAAAGGTATATRSRIKGSGGNNDVPHGKVTLETQSVINRATTAADVTALKAEVTRLPRPTLVFPKDLSGNGGPAFTRT